MHGSNNVRSTYRY